MHSRAKYFFVFAIFLISILFFYVGWQLLLPITQNFKLELISWGILLSMFLSILSMPLFFWLRKGGKEHGFLSHFFMQFAYFSMAATSFLFTYTLIRHLIRFLMYLGNVHSAILWGPKSSFLIFSLTTVSIAAGSFFARKIPNVKELSIPFDSLPFGLKNFKIIQISDLHIGTAMNKEFVKKVVQRTNAEKPQLIVLTGDIIDGAISTNSTIIEELGRLSAECGVFYVPGNHEYYWDIENCLSALRQQKNIQILLNEWKNITWGASNFTLAGVTDPAGENFSPEHKCDPLRAISGADPKSFKILLAHQPKVALVAAELGYDLQISGHTHGGQFFPWTIVVKLFHPVDRGLEKIKKMWVYVSCGTGSWGPWIRLGAPAEITSIRLV